MRRAKRIDPRIFEIAETFETGQRVTVLLKLDPEKSRYASLPPSNAPDSERERIFGNEVQELVHEVHAGQVRIGNVAANVGVITIEATIGIVMRLIESEKINGAKLVARP